MADEDSYTKCRYCGVNEMDEECGCFCKECSENRPRKMTVEQYLEALKKVREVIANNALVGLDDYNVTGHKHTHCAWGMCTNSAEVWDKSELHIWPMDFKENGRIAPLGKPSKCPLDYRPKGDMSGCFYRCWAFTPPKVGKRAKTRFELTRVGALERYDFEIRRLEIGLRNGWGYVCRECGCESSYDNPLARGKDGKPICGDCHRKYVTIVVHDLTGAKRIPSSEREP